MPEYVTRLRPGTTTVRVRRPGGTTRVRTRLVGGGTGGTFDGVHNDLPGRSTADAHPAAAVTYDPALSPLTAETVQAAIDEAAGATQNHVDDDTAAHTAAAISVDAAGFAGNLDPADVTVQAVAERVDGLDVAPSGHDHDGTYSPVGHNHDGAYVPVGSSLLLPSPAGQPDGKIAKVVSEAWAIGDDESGGGGGAAWTVIDTDTLLVDTAAIAVSGITGYDEVEVLIRGRSTHTLGAQTDLLVQCNGDTAANYSWATLGKRGSGNLLTNSASDTVMQTDLAVGTSMVGADGTNYVTVKCWPTGPTDRYKTVAMSVHGHAYSSSVQSPVVAYATGSWMNTVDGITSLSIFLGNGSWVAGTEITVLGRNLS